MLAWENSGFSIDASVRISLIDRDVPSYFPSLEHPHGGGWIMVGEAGGGSAVGDSPGFFAYNLGVSAEYPPR